MGEESLSIDRKKLLLGNGHQVRTQVGPLICQAKLNPQILTVEIDRGFGNV